MCRDPLRRDSLLVRKVDEYALAVVTLIGPNRRLGRTEPTDSPTRTTGCSPPLAYTLEHKADAVVPVFFDTTTTTAYRDLPPNLIGMRDIQGLELSRGRTGRRTWIA